MMKFSQSNIYQFHHENYMYNGLLKRINTSIHRLMEKPYDKSRIFKQVIEFGATDGYHFNFVKHNFNVYTMTDINEPYLRASIGHLNQDPRIEIQYFDINNPVRIEENSYDRIILTCLIQHVRDLNSVLKWLHSILRENGVITIYVHLDNSHLLKFVRSVYSFYKYGFSSKDYLAWVKTQHLWSPKQVDTEIKKLFGNTYAVQSFPLNLKNQNLCLASIYHCLKT